MHQILPQEYTHLKKVFIKFVLKKAHIQRKRGNKKAKSSTYCKPPTMQYSRMQELGMRVAPLEHAVDQTTFMTKEYEHESDNKWYNDWQCYLYTVPHNMSILIRTKFSLAYVMKRWHVRRQLNNWDPDIQICRYAKTTINLKWRDTLFIFLNSAINLLNICRLTQNSLNFSSCCRNNIISEKKIVIKKQEISQFVLPLVLSLTSSTSSWSLNTNPDYSNLKEKMQLVSEISQFVLPRWQLRKSNIEWGKK